MFLLILILSCPLVLPASLILVMVSLVVPPQLDPWLLLLFLVFDVITDLQMLGDIFCVRITCDYNLILIICLRLFEGSFGLLFLVACRGLFVWLNAPCRASCQFFTDIGLLAATFCFLVFQILGLFCIIDFEGSDDLRRLLGHLLFGGNLSQVDGELQEISTELEFPVL